MVISGTNQTLIHAAADESKLECDDVIPEILCRLPPKYVFRSKVVSKSWQATVAHSSFVPRHTRFHDTARRQIGGLLFVHWMFWLRYVALTYFEDGGRRYVNGAHLSTFGHRLQTYSVTNACRGMVCVLGSTVGYLANPSIEEAAPLPGGAHSDSAPPSGGLFFDERTGRYDVLRMFRRVDGSTGCEMLTLGPGEYAWRPVADPPFPAFHDAPPVFAGGLVLWLVKDPFELHEDAPRALVGFDPKKEAFALIELPKGCGAPADGAGIVELDGQLCYWERYDAERRIRIWESSNFEWRTSYCVDDLIAASVHEARRDWAPVAAWRGKIVMSNGRCQMAYYDRGAKTFDPEIASVPYGRVMTYTGTLLSPKTLLQKPTSGGGEGAQAAAQLVAPMLTHPNIW